MSQTSSEHNALRVFSCSTCRNIVADSLSLVYSHDELQTVTFSGVTNKVAPEQTLHTSRERLDKGATFNNLLCTECVQVIGKQYITTPRSLDALRDKFTLYVDRLDTFHLGKVDVGQCGRDDEFANQTVPHHGSTVVEDIAKVQHVLVDLVLRLNEVERLLGISSGIPTVSTGETLHEAVPSSAVASPQPSTSGMKRSAIQQSSHQHLASFVLAQPASVRSPQAERRDTTPQDPKRRKTHHL